MADVDLDELEKEARYVIDLDEPGQGQAKVTLDLIKELRLLRKRNAFIEDAYAAQAPNFKDWLDKQSYGHSVKDAWIRELQKGTTLQTDELREIDPTTNEGIQEAAQLFRMKESFT